MGRDGRRYKKIIFVKFWRKSFELGEKVIEVGFKIHSKGLKDDWKKFMMRNERQKMYWLCNKVSEDGNCQC